MVDKTKINFKHFTWEEFDSPDAPGSGYMCSLDLLHKLNVAREHAKCPFKITSGYRTKAYNKDLQKRGYKASVNSSHCKGLAADIAITDSKRRWTIINALIIPKSIPNYPSNYLLKCPVSNGSILLKSRISD